MQNLKRTVGSLNRKSANAFKADAKMPLSIILDNVRSGHNVGSVFRTADAFNVQKIYLAGITATPPNKEILKTALGSTLSVAWEQTNDALQCIRHLQAQHYKVYAVEQTVGSVSLESFSWGTDEYIALVLGNEVDGVAQHLVDQCDGSIEIPQFGTKHSLNVSVSAGIVLWHLVSQQLRTGVIKAE